MSVQNRRRSRGRAPNALSQSEYKSAGATSGMIGRCNAKRTALMVRVSDGSSMARSDGAVALFKGEYPVLAQECLRDAGNGRSLLQPLIVLDALNAMEIGDCADQRLRLQHR